MLSFDQHVQLPTLSEADYVHDIVYDYYGTRLALCTSSLRISIFSAPAGSQAEPGAAAAGSGAWTETARMERAHAGPIWRLSWGHPEFGEPLASCSEDRVVTIWYCDPAANNASAAVAQRGSDGSRALPSWQRRAQLQGEGPFVDVRFAPSSIGLKLAACTADGRAKIFECVNRLDLRSWEAEDLESLAHRAPATSASPTASAAAGAGAVPGANFCASAALDWMRAPFGGSGDERGEVLAVAGRAGRLAIWSRDNNRWKEVVSSEAHPVQSGGVKDLAWCPNLCRPYEIIATCGAGARLWRVDFPSQDEAYGAPQSRKVPSPACQLQLLKELVPAADEVCPVWRCSWNLTGTTLSLCPESGEISVWKANASLDWRQECGIELADAQ